MTPKEAYKKGYEEAMTDLLRMEKTNPNDFGNQIKGFIKGFFTTLALEANTELETQESEKKYEN